MRTREGSFFYGEGSVKAYAKPPKTLVEQLDLLISRGLLVQDRQYALHWLSQISYYRLRGYTYPFQNNSTPDHPFFKPTDLQFILDHYEFDRELRLLILDAIERVEIALRTQLIYQFSVEYGAWWYKDVKLFRNSTYHAKDMETLDKELSRSSEVFIEHYRNTYDQANRPPAWICLEVVSFGLLSKMFQNLPSSLTPKKAIISHFGLKAGGFRIFENWMYHFSLVRNICAHHSRLWNRVLSNSLIFASDLSAPWVVGFPDCQKVYATACLLAWLVRRITGKADWARKFVRLVKERFPQISKTSMGFPEKWEDQPLWKDVLE
jgi:abortive infection bacteriophage resistance protein